MSVPSRLPKAIATRSAPVQFGVAAAALLFGFFAILWVASALTVDVPTENAAWEGAWLALGFVALWTVTLTGGHLLARRRGAQVPDATPGGHTAVAGLAAAATLLVVLMVAGSLLFTHLHPAIAVAASALLAAAIGLLATLIVARCDRRSKTTPEAELHRA